MTAPSTPSIYFSGQGIVSVAIRDALGIPQGFTEIGNVPAFTIKPGRAATRYATDNAIGGARFGVSAGDVPSYSLTVEDVRKENLRQFLLAAQTDVVPATANNQAILLFPGKKTPLSHLQVSAVYFPNKTENVDYIVHSAAGTIESITMSGPYTVAYNHGAYSKFAPFTQSPFDIWLRLEGLNTEVNSNPCVVDIFKTTLPPIDKMDFINEDLLSYGFEGVMKRDVTQIGAQFFLIRTVYS